MTDINFILFDKFETLDAFGPAEIISKIPEKYNLNYCSVDGGIVTSSQNIQVNTLSFDEIKSDSIILIPGGFGTRELVKDSEFISQIANISQNAPFILTVCTGTALLAKTGLLDNHSATTNKMAFDWVVSLNDKVDWIREARWVVDGRFYTSSGVSAGMDMTLGFISDNTDRNTAIKIAKEIEYIWNEDKNIDPFS